MARLRYALIGLLGALAGLSVLAAMAAQEEAARLRGMLSNRDTIRR